jgi:ferredoxin
VGGQIVHDDDVAGLEGRHQELLHVSQEGRAAHGLNPDYSCRSGICHTCMCALVEGEVEYLEDPLDEPDPGCVLICCSRPKSNIVIEV